MLTSQVKRLALGGQVLVHRTGVGIRSGAGVEQGKQADSVGDNDSVDWSTRQFVSKEIHPTYTPLLVVLVRNLGPWPINPRSTMSVERLI
jgi:hypothetical protein